MIRIPGGTFRMGSDRQVRRATVFFTSLWLATGGVGASPRCSLPTPRRRLRGAGRHIKIERRPDGGQFGVCVFTDNYQCEEWAMFRGECSVGGLRVLGYITPAARYCAITGGRYTAVVRSGAIDEQGGCALPGGETCAAAPTTPVPAAGESRSEGPSQTVPRQAADQPTSASANSTRRSRRR